MEKEKEVVEVRDIERELYGYTGGEMEYTPAIFEAMEIPEDKRFSVTIKPLSDADCTLIRHINDNIKTEKAYEHFSWQWLNAVKPFLSSKNSVYIFNCDKMLFALKQGMELAGYNFSQDADGFVDSVNITGNCTDGSTITVDISTVNTGAATDPDLRLTGDVVANSGQIKWVCTNPVGLNQHVPSSCRS